VVVRFTGDEARAAAAQVGHGAGPDPRRSPRGDDRRFEGRVHLVDETGTSVVCDIDDTARETGVTDPKMLIQTTFFRPFRPVPAVRDLCARLAADGAQFSLRFILTLAAL